MNCGDIIFYIKIFTGYSIMGLCIPFIVIGMKLISDQWISKSVLMPGLHKMCLVKEYGGEENLELITSFYETYVKSDKKP